MLTLCINTALPETSIALLSGDRVLGEETWLDPRSESRRVLPAIEGLLTRCGKKIQQVRRVTAIKGPGIFTGLRIGITIANTVIYAQKADSASFNTLTFLRARIAEPFDGAVILQTAPDVFFCAAADATGDDEIERVSPERISLIRGRVTGFMFPETTKLLSGPHSWVEPQRSFGETMRYLLISNRGEKGASIVPLYLREPGITVAKKR